MTEPVNNPISNVPPPPLVPPQTKDALTEVVFKSETIVEPQLPALTIILTNVTITLAELIQMIVLPFQLAPIKPQFCALTELAHH